MSTFVIAGFQLDFGGPPQIWHIGALTPVATATPRSKPSTNKSVSHPHISNSGDIVRLQPNHISFSSLEAVEAIHGVRTKTRKGEVYETVMRHTPTAPLTLFSETWISSDDADSVTRNDTAFFDELQILYSVNHS